MKRLLAHSLVFISLITGVSQAFAQADLVKQKAQKIRDANNASQGVQPNTPPPAAPAPAAPSGPQGISATQQANIDKLETDISNIRPAAKVADDSKKQMLDDTLNLAKGTVKPSKQSLTNLINHLSVALADKDVSLLDPAPAQLAKYINISVNSANLTPGVIQPVITAVQNLLRTANVTEDNYKPVVADLKAIVADLQKNKAKTY